MTQLVGGAPRSATVTHVRTGRCRVATVYERIGEPPVGASVQVIVADPPSADAVIESGMPGTLAGMTGSEGSELGEAPRRFTARTVKAYDVPFVRPMTVQASSVAGEVTTTEQDRRGMSVVVTT